MANKENWCPYISGQKFQAPQSKSLNSQDSVVSFGCLDPSERESQALDQMCSDSDLHELQYYQQCFMKKQFTDRNLFSNSRENTQQSSGSFKQVRDLLKTYQQQIRSLTKQLSDAHSSNAQLVEYAEFLISEVNEQKDRQQGVERMFVSRDERIQELNRMLNLTKGESSMKIVEVSTQLQQKYENDLAFKQREIEKLLAEKQDHTHEIAALREDGRALKEMLVSQEAQVNSLRKQKSDLQDLLGSMQDRLGQMQELELQIKQQESAQTLESKVKLLLSENEKLNMLLNEKLAELDYLRKDRQQKELTISQGRKQMTQQYEALLQERQLYFETEKQLLQKQILELSDQLKGHAHSLRSEHEKQIAAYKDQLQRQSLIIGEYQTQVQKLEAEFNHNSEFLKQKFYQHEIQYNDLYKEKQYLENKLQLQERQLDQNQRNLAQLQQINDSLEYEVNQLKYEVIANKPRHQDPASTLQQQVERQQKKIHEMGNCQAHLITQNQELLHIFQDKVKTLERQLNDELRPSDSKRNSSGHPINQLRMYALQTPTPRKGIFDNSVRMSRSRSFIS